MDENGFWAVVDTSLRESGGDLERQVEVLAEQLHRLEPAEIVSFDDWYTRASHALYSWRTWRAADLMIGDASDDVFADFRSWVISRGRAVHAAVVADPDAGLAALGLDDPEEVADGELFGAQAGEVYTAKTGVSLFDLFPGRPVADFPDQDPDGPEVSGDRKARRAQFPLLSARYPEVGPSWLPSFLRPRRSIRFPWRD